MADSNADKIRAMSDEDLAKYLSLMDSCPVSGWDCLHHAEVQCEQCILQWLKSNSN